MNYFIKKAFTSKFINLSILLIVVTSLGYSSLIVAKEVNKEYSLKIEPEQCVAMRQGQLCYADVIMNWKAEDSGNYCLFSSLQPSALRCWSNSKSGKHEQEISSDENIIFSLKKQGSLNDLITQELEMAWVYDKSTRKNISWRMF